MAWTRGGPLADRPVLKASCIAVAQLIGPARWPPTAHGDGPHRARAPRRAAAASASETSARWLAALRAQRASLRTRGWRAPRSRAARAGRMRPGSARDTFRRRRSDVSPVLCSRRRLQEERQLQTEDRLPMRKRRLDFTDAIQAVRGIDYVLSRRTICDLLPRTVKLIARQKPAYSERSTRGVAGTAGSAPREGGQHPEVRCCSRRAFHQSQSNTRRRASAREAFARLRREQAWRGVRSATGALLWRAGHGERRLRCRPGGAAGTPHHAAIGQRHRRRVPTSVARPA
jgi:hypothetical protein